MRCPGRGLRRARGDTGGGVNLLLPATGVHRIGGAQEVMPTPQFAVQPLNRRHASCLGANRMVLAGAGLPEPAAGPGHLFSARLESESGILALSAQAQAVPKQPASP